MLSLKSFNLSQIGVIGLSQESVMLLAGGLGVELVSTDKVIESVEVLLLFTGKGLPSFVELPSQPLVVG